VDALQFQLKLVDQMSAPLGAESKALGVLEKELLRAQAVMKSFEAQQKSMRQAKASAAGPEALKAFNLGEESKLAKAQVAMAKKRIAEQSKAEKLALKEADRAKKAGAKDLLKQQAAMDEALSAGTEEMLAYAGAAAGAAAAVAVLAAAVGAVVIAGASLAIEAAEAKGDTVDMLDAMLGSAEAADRTYAAITDITRDLAVSQQGVQALASELSAAGVTNEAMLLDAVKSISQVDSVIKGAGSKIEKIVEKAAQTGKFKLNEKQLVGTGIQTQKLYEEIAARTGKGVKEVEAQLKAGKISAEVGIAALTKVVDNKFGGLAAKQAKDFPAQMQRFKDSIGRLFEDVNTGPFLDALDRITRLFDTATPSGKALHDIITKVFDSIFSAVAKVGPYVEIFFNGMVILALRVAIALKPLLKKLGMIGENTDSQQALADILDEIAFVVGDVTSALVKFFSYAPLWDPLIDTVSFVADVFGLLFDANLLVLSGIGWVIDAAADVIGWLTGLGDAALNAGSDLVTGLVDGVINMGGEFVQAVTDLAMQGIDAFKSVFKISSPSKVMDSMGQNLVLGVVQGIDTQSEAANDSLAAAVSPPPTSVSAVTTNRGGSVNLTVNVTINGTDKSVEELRSMLVEVMSDVIEEASLLAGTQPENAEEAA
jgi:hypothetical protein